MIFVYNSLRYHSRWNNDTDPDPSALGDLVDLEDHVFHMHQLGGQRYLRIAIKEGSIFAVTPVKLVDFHVIDGNGRADLAVEYGVPARPSPTGFFRT